MKPKKLVSVMLVTLILAAAGCGSDGGDGDTTLREALQSFAEEFCNQLEECDPESTPSNCATQLVGAVCAETNCDVPYTATAELQDCLDDLTSLTCTQLEDGDFPASCPE